MPGARWRLRRVWPSPPSCRWRSASAPTPPSSASPPAAPQPAPVRRPDRLAILWNRLPGLGITEDWFSTAQCFDIRHTGAFAEVALAIGGNYNLTGDGEPERIGTIRVSSNLLPMLGVRPELGRCSPRKRIAPAPRAP